MHMCNANLHRSPYYGSVSCLITRQRNLSISVKALVPSCPYSMKAQSTADMRAYMTGHQYLRERACPSMSLHDPLGYLQR